jgi:hypothetical protein
VVDNPDHIDRMTLHCEVAAPVEGLAEAMAASIRDLTKLRGEVSFHAPGQPCQRRQGDRRRAQVRINRCWRGRVSGAPLIRRFFVDGGGAARCGWRVKKYFQRPASKAGAGG